MSAIRVLQDGRIDARGTISPPHQRRIHVPSRLEARGRAHGARTPGLRGHRGRAEPKVEVEDGATTLALDPGTAAALTDAGIAVKPIGYAKATDDGIAFPVVGGWLTADPVGGRIHHLGGLRLRSDDTTVRLRNFVVRLDEDPDLLAKVDNADERVSIADLDLSQAQVSLDGSRLQASGVIATLSADGAAALNAAFGLQLPAGLPIGTANVDAELEADDD